MTTQITIAPIAFTDADAEGTRWAHPLELFTHRESRAWIVALLALRAQPSRATRARGATDDSAAAVESRADVASAKTRRPYGTAA